MTGGDQASLPAAYAVAGRSIPTWPDTQRVEPLSAPLTGITTFADHAAYHDALIEAVLAAERDPRFRGEMFRGACGVKVRDIAHWNAAAASLVHARAILLAHRTLSRRPVFVDDCWASVYRAADYLHHVNPYAGTRPRITLSWNITLGRLAGRAGEGWTAAGP